DCLDVGGDIHKVSDEGELVTGCHNAIVTSTWVNDGGWDTLRERTFNLRYYSSDDIGGAPVYGSSAGAVFAQGYVILRNTEGVVVHPAQ
ncbi:MAG: hypothetical protein NZ740_10300, partial [Kiritimatiellae bacterium]|nr:hypothetical protein [Kiritimatiellia bacterium]MDW8459479.1 hypothetical protein [Verrucomicrobiota bacterium]